MADIRITQVATATPVGADTVLGVKDGQVKRFSVGDIANSQDALGALAASSGAALVGFVQSGAGAVARTAQDKMRERVTVLDYIPVAEHAAIKAYTSTYDCGSDFASAFAVAKRVSAPAGLYCVSNLVVPSGCVLVGDECSNANATAAYPTRIKHIATELSDVITCDSGDTANYQSGGVIQNVSIQPGDYSRYGIDLNNLLGARLHNIQGAGYFSGAFISIKGPLMLEIDGLNYLNTGTRTPAAVHFRSYDGQIIGTTVVVRRAYIHGASTQANGILHAFKWEPAACLNTILEDCITESISGSVFEIGKGNIVWVNDQYMENVPNTDSASYPIFNVGVNGASAPNNAYDTSTALHVSRLYGLGFSSGSFPSNVKLVASDVAAEVNLCDISANRVNTLITGTNSTQRVRLRDLQIPSVATVHSGLTVTKVHDRGGNVFAATVAHAGTANYGLQAERANIAAAVKHTGFQYWGTDIGTRGALEVWDRTAEAWYQPMPVSTVAPTTQTWRRGDVVFNSAAAAGLNAGWVCVAAGTPGTWAPFGSAGALSSVDATPSYVGQTAVVAGVGYMATGTISSADWKQTTN
jgi:hypothetical protein